MEKLIGREAERREIDRCLKSDRSELVIVYGRRRIGKTFLIEQHFNQTFDLVCRLSQNPDKRAVTQVWKGSDEIS